MSRSYIISYVLYTIFILITGYAAKIIKDMKNDKNSYYNKMIELADKEKETLEQRMGYEEFNHLKQQAQDIVYKVEQLGKELAWDSITKHNKALEWISASTGLSEKEINDIIKTTVGMINSNKR